jgi:hypothetical protein
MAKKGGKSKNPNDVYRKEQKKKAIKKNKLQNEKKKQIANALRDPERVQREVDNMQKMEQQGKLDKRSRKQMEEVRVLFFGCMPSM